MSPREPWCARFTSTLGLSDGSLTEVESTELKEGTSLVVGEMESQPAGKPAPGGSPFTPQLLRKSANGPRSSLSLEQHPAWEGG